MTVTHWSFTRAQLSLTGGLDTVADPTLRRWGLGGYLKGLCSSVATGAVADREGGLSSTRR
jgi:hypothetical protein